jgi:hypothetical protein
MKFNLDEYKPWEKSLLGKISLKYLYSGRGGFQGTFSIVVIIPLLFLDFVLIYSTLLMLFNPITYQKFDFFPFVMVILTGLYIIVTFNIFRILINFVYTLKFWYKKKKDDLDFFIIALENISDNLKHFQFVISSAFERIKKKEIQVDDEKIINAYNFMNKTMKSELPILILLDKKNYDKILKEVNDIKETIKDKKSLSSVYPNIRKIDEMYLNFEKTHSEIKGEGIFNKISKFLTENKTAVDTLKSLITIAIIIIGFVLILLGKIPIQTIFKGY